MNSNEAEVTATKKRLGDLSSSFTPYKLKKGKDTKTGIKGQLKSSQVNIPGCA